MRRKFSVHTFSSFEDSPIRIAFHHSGRVAIAGIQPFNAVERGDAQRKHHRHEARPAPPRQHPRLRSGGHGRRPVDVLPRQIRRVIEGSGIVVIVRPPDPRVDFDVLAVIEALRRLAVVQGKADARPSLAIQLQRELLAVGRKYRGLDHAAFENQDFPRSGVDFRRRSGPMPGFIGNSSERHRQQNADDPQDSPPRRRRQRQKRNHWPQRFAQRKSEYSAD